MAVWKKLGAPSLRDMLDVLNGAQIGTVNLIDGADVDGLAFIVNTTGTPRTTTFTAKGRFWTAEEIVAAINSAHADLADCAHIKVSPPGMRLSKWLSIWKDGGATVKFTDSTANALLGFSTTADQVQAVRDPSTVKNLEKDPMSQDSWFAVVYE